MLLGTTVECVSTFECSDGDLGVSRDIIYKTRKNWFYSVYTPLTVDTLRPEVSRRFYVTPLLSSKGDACVVCEWCGPDTGGRGPRHPSPPVVFPGPPSSWSSVRGVRRGRSYSRVVEEMCVPVCGVCAHVVCTVCGVYTCGVCTVCVVCIRAMVCVRVYIECMVCVRTCGVYGMCGVRTVYVWGLNSGSRFKDSVGSPFCLSYVFFTLGKDPVRLGFLFILMQSINLVP